MTNPESSKDEQSAQEKTPRARLVIATRLHLGRSSSPPSNEQLRKIVLNMETLRLRATMTMKVAPQDLGSQKSVALDDHQQETRRKCSDEDSCQNIVVVDEAVVVIAVDATPKIDGYDYVQAVRDTISEVASSSPENNNNKDGGTEACTKTNIHVLPVTPWGSFVPALNATVLYAKNQLDGDLLMFVSAEVDASSRTIATLCTYVLHGITLRRNAVVGNKGSNDNLHHANVFVAGAALPGHDYQGGNEGHHIVDDSGSTSSTVEVCSVHATNATSTTEAKIVPLSGRTSPWNTLCVWDIQKLSLVGFACISDIGPNAGVEECAAIAILETLLSSSSSSASILPPPTQFTPMQQQHQRQQPQQSSPAVASVLPDAVACLVKVDDIRWDTTDSFKNDEGRKQWHDQKMKSKNERPQWQLEQLNLLSGVVVHL